MNLEATYRARFARSAQHAAEAQRRFPGGVTHDGRSAVPFPLFIERAVGAFKYDADENRLIDYWCGHGALLLGHGHPAILAALRQQIDLGTHAGGEHALALRWAELVQQLVPGAERVRFTSSGTEATMLAMRLARAFTQRPLIVRFQGHFHGWHDGAAPGADPTDPGAGLTAEQLASLLTLPPELEAVATTLAQRNDVAAVILEPTGASYGTVPLPPNFLRELRALTAAHEVLLICDEIVTGFRVSPGGAQAQAGITGDLICLAKIVAGGLAGGAVAGREVIMRRLAMGAAEAGAQGRIRHQGTYNANPLAAAAGVACLELVATGEPGATAAERGQALQHALNQVLQARKLHGFSVYGEGSILHLFADPACELEPGTVPHQFPLARLKAGGDPAITTPLRMALQLAGVDLMRGRSAFVSAAHSSATIAATAAAFDDALALLERAGLLK
ncbi:aspartate aminotransferase family protein [Candidatus Viridilinea mediisalina]|uniref:Aspartate aminotransferase family protein n=1 Tax=Candidatus Viridilinea mediisalina TaxID=2024553 RepID=A0A2A6RFR3_9CHLR|nr:aminotransferase class III-fold pyridoxal phosphate-dependent enzyme [Candidatus Viridilinea mediisalina]PDW01726.1 aspartate aminotransferase family protein [Candidatus Viridilinea mediisalina]